MFVEEWKKKNKINLFDGPSESASLVFRESSLKMKKKKEKKKLIGMET